MPEVQPARLSVLSLNTRGVPLVGSGLARRYAKIGATVEAGDADIACFQEVFSWWHLRLLARRMRTFRHASFRPSLAGPAGGLVTFSRLPVSGTAYRAFGVPPHVPGISRAARFRAALKGALVTGLARSGLYVVNTHPVANRDGDWSRGAGSTRCTVPSWTSWRRSCAASRPRPWCAGTSTSTAAAPCSAGSLATGLADAFKGNCPATFRAEYLPAGESPRCIDFILTAGGVRAEAASVMFTGTEQLPGGPDYVSDHIGLRASLALAP